MASRLFVGNIPFGTTEGEIREHFSQVGPVSSVILPTDRTTGQIRGFAFVDFPDSSLALQAIERFNNQPFKGRNLSVSEARPKGEGPSSGRGFTPRGSSGPAGGFSRSRGSGPRDSLVDDGMPRRNFRPDARSRKKGSAKGPKSEWAVPRPKGPLREINTGRIYGVEELDDKGKDDDLELFPKDEPVNDEDEEKKDKG